MQVLPTHTISFSIDKKEILTDQGALHVNNRFVSDNQYIPATIRNSPTEDAIMMNNSWVQQGLRNLLWLPHEYRSRHTNVHGNMLAIGQHSGHVCLFSSIIIRYHLDGTVYSSLGYVLIIISRRIRCYSPC